MLPETDFAVAIEPNPFCFEEGALEMVVAFSEGGFGDFAFGIDDSVPRDVVGVGDAEEGIADETGLARESGKLGDLSVGGDASRRDLADDIVDLVVLGHRAAHERMRSIVERSRGRRLAIGKRSKLPLALTEWQLERHRSADYALTADFFGVASLRSCL
jgi:hypothetical protein